MKKILSYFPFFHFYELIGNFFYSTWDIKLYIEVTKNYDMVMNKKFFNLIFFVTFFYLWKIPKNIFLFFPARKILTSSRLRTRTRANPIKLGTRLLGVLWRHQNGMWQSGFLIGPFVPRDINTRFWLVGLYTVSILLLSCSLK